MIKLFIGDNDFEMTRAVEKITTAFNGTVERFDGSELTPEKLVDITSGVSLFSSERCIVIKGMSENKSLWTEAVKWLELTGDDTQIVLVEPGLDKRTKTAKWLQKNGTVETFAAWGDHDADRAARWLADEAQKQGVIIDRRVIQRIVERVGVDQWQLYHALEKVRLLDEVTLAAIEQIVEPSTHENIFNLFETALRGDRQKVAQMLEGLKKNEDAYRVFGLLTSQALQLVALTTTRQSPRETAMAIGAHPFAIQKLAPYAKQYQRTNAKVLIDAFAKADRRMKTTDTQPWMLVEQVLFSIPPVKSE